MCIQFSIWHWICNVIVHTLSDLSGNALYIQCTHFSGLSGTVLYMYCTHISVVRQVLHFTRTAYTIQWSVWYCTLHVLHTYFSDPSGTALYIHVLFTYFNDLSSTAHISVVCLVVVLHFTCTVHIFQCSVPYCTLHVLCTHFSGLSDTALYMYCAHIISVCTVHVKCSISDPSGSALYMYCIHISVVCLVLYSTCKEQYQWSIR